MVEIENSIDNFYQEIETKIDGIIEELKDIDGCNIDDDNKINEMYHKRKLSRLDIQWVWKKFEGFSLGKKKEKLLIDLQDNNKNKDWYLTAEKIQERFKDRFKGSRDPGYPKYTKIDTCIICHKKPNCLNIHNPTRKESREMRY